MISSFCSIFFSEQYFDCDYDNQKSFSDFVPFGGWKAPFMKVWNTYSFLTSFFLSSLPNSDFDVQQYNGNRTSCGVGANFDWMPYVYSLPLSFFVLSALPSSLIRRHLFWFNTDYFCRGGNSTSGPSMFPLPTPYYLFLFLSYFFSPLFLFSPIFTGYYVGTIATGPATHSTSSTTHATSTTTHATSAAVTHSTSTTTHSTSAVVTHATSTTTHSTSADVTHATSTVTHATSTTTHSTSTDATHSTGTTTHATSADVTHSTVAATHSTGS